MKRTLFFMILIAVACLARAEDDSSAEFPSPDGRFAFRTIREDDGHKAELIEKASGKVVQVVAKTDEGRFSFSALWSPDGKRVAMSISTSRLSSAVEVYERNGAKFREVPLPSVAEPKFPAKYEREKRVWHWAELDWRTPVRWTEAGALVIKCESTRDGNESDITATRTVTFGFDRKGAARILSNVSKVTTHFEE